MIPTSPRIEAIKGLPEASGRESVAHLLAFGTHFSAEVCQRILAVVPLSHAGGSLFGPTLLKNGTMVVMPGFDPGEVLRVIQDYKIVGRRLLAVR